MKTLAGATWAAAVVGRWIARIVGTLLTLGFLAFIFGEGPPPLWRLPWQQNLQFLGMCGVCVGLVLAWKWEGWGAAVTLACYGVLLLVDPRFNTGRVMAIPAATGLLHFFCWWRIRAGSAQVQKQ